MATGETETTATSKPLRVAMLWDDLRFLGGSERRMIETCYELRSLGVEVLCMFRAADSKEGSNVRSMFSHAGAETKTATSWWRATQALRRLDFDALFSFGIRASLCGRALRAEGRTFTHVMPRNGLDLKWSSTVKFADRLLSPFVDVYLANSFAVAEELRRRALPPAKIRVLPGAVSSEWVRLPAGPRLSGPARIIMIGNWRPEKNQAQGLAALARVSTPYELCVYTNNAQPFAILAKELGLKLHAVENAIVEPIHYDGADVLLHPSRMESLPRVVLEGVARGIFVIAYDVGDTSRVVDPERSVILEPTNEGAGALAKALNWAVEHVEEIRATRAPHPVTTSQDYALQLVELLRESQGRVQTG